MLKEYLNNLYDFTCWGRDRMLDTAQALTPEQFDQETRFPIHTIKETLVHTLSAELAYRKRCMGEAYTKGVEKQDFADIPAIRKFWADEEKVMRQYLATAEDDAL